MKKMVNKETMELGTQEFTAQNTKFFTYSGSKFRFKIQIQKTLRSSPCSTWSKNQSKDLH